MRYLLRPNRKKVFLLSLLCVSVCEIIVETLVLFLHKNNFL